MTTIPQIVLDCPEFKNIKPIHGTSLIEKLSSPARHYHSLDNHIAYLLQVFDTDKLKNLVEDFSGVDDVHLTDKNIVSAFRYAILYHDSVWNAVKQTESASNEQASNDFWLEVSAAELVHPSVAHLVSKLILGTDFSMLKTKKDFEAMGKFFRESPYLSDYLVYKFNLLDLTNFVLNSPSKIHQDTLRIYKEFQFLTWKDFSIGQREFLSNYGIIFPECLKGIQTARDFLWSYKPKCAIYPGSFDPFHPGHLDIIRQAEKIFDKVIIAILPNPSKSASQLKERVAEIKEILPNYDIQPDLTTLYDVYGSFFVNEGFYPSVIRGMRSVDDFREEEVYKASVELVIKQPDFVYFMASSKYKHLSSSLLRGASIDSREKFLKTAFERVTDG